LITSRGNKRKTEIPRTEVSAGGIVFKKTKRGVFFAMLKDSYGKWTFPKGHVRRGEAYEKAAEREVGEEMGIYRMSLIKRLGTIDIWFRDRFVFKGKLVHKYIHYYLFEVTDNIRLRTPKPTETGERIQGVAWVPAHDVATRSNYKDMKTIIRKAFEHLEIPYHQKTKNIKKKRKFYPRKKK